MHFKLRHAYLISLHRDKHFRSPITHQCILWRQLHCLIKQCQGTFSIAAPLYSLAIIIVSATDRRSSAPSLLHTIPTQPSSTALLG